MERNWQECNEYILLFKTVLVLSTFNFLIYSFLYLFIPSYNTTCQAELLFLTSDSAAAVRKIRSWSRVQVHSYINFISQIWESRLLSDLEEFDWASVKFSPNGFQGPTWIPLSSVIFWWEVLIHCKPNWCNVWFFNNGRTSSYLGKYGPL